jgi:hypothetical protein
MLKERALCRNADAATRLAKAGSTQFMDEV